MNAQTEHDLTVIEHLDFEHLPKCEARVLSCGGANAAEYLAVNKLCHPEQQFLCSPCVTTRMAHAGFWSCGACGLTFPAQPFLDVVTLHPLGGAS